jgi:hypothetical protein
MLPGAARTVAAVQEGGTDLSPPINSKITWEFGPGENTDGFKYYWYDGYVDAEFDRDSWQLKKGSNEYNHPSAEVLSGKSFKKYGSVVIGTEGKLFFNRGRGFELERETPFAADEVPQSIPRAPRQNNYQEWFDAIEGKIDEGQSNFALAGPMTETILLGVLAQRFPDTQHRWNAETMEIEGRPELSRFIRRDYREGWEIDV